MTKRKQVKKPGDFLKKMKSVPEKSTLASDDPIRLNRFIAISGICSRREADKLIASGKIRVNGKVVTEMGHKVMRHDNVTYGKARLAPQDYVYVLLNKPKDFITTMNDPQNRRTVMDLVKISGDQRIYPVGRLDRNTMGLLLLTNDGDLAKKLTHPSHKVAKVYHIVLNKPLQKTDLTHIRSGLELEDGIVQVDKIEVISNGRKEIGLEIHIGKNRIVRRIFEHLGYEIAKLDRVYYAGLTKKDIPRGKWRFLTEKEIIRLKHFIK